MTNSEDVPLGKCLQMCPAKEISLREREGLLHEFEISTDLIEPRPKNQINRRGIRHNSKADPTKVVKAFSRSAAGLDMTKPEDLRPPHILLKTVKYLCHEVMLKDAPFNVIYDYVFDRLRAVRSDLFIQRICDKTGILILETCVRFHIYASFRMKTILNYNFDPHINQRHLIDCLKRLISFYEINDYWEESRAEFESLYILVSPESFEVLSRALSLRRIIKSKVYDNSIEICLAYQRRNYIQFFRRVQNLPLVISLYLIHHVKLIRSSALKVLSTSHSSSSKVPFGLLMNNLLYKSEKDLESDLSIYSFQKYQDPGTKLTCVKLIKLNGEDFKTKEHLLSDSIGGMNWDLFNSQNMEFITKEICRV